MKIQTKELSVLTIILIYGILCITTTGCSVAMALSGKRDPNLGIVRVGATRGEVEMQLGNPVASVTTEEGKRTDIYEYEIGNEPSAGRAIAHGVMDLLTWGIWEAIGTPVEGLKGKKYQITVIYDSDNRVLAINQPVAPNLLKKDVVEASTTKAEPVVSVQSMETKLDQIKSLKDKGKITEEEYTMMRKDILSNPDKMKETPKESENIKSPKTPY